MKNRFIETLPPSSFALVMATGIVATASHLFLYPVISKVFFWIANISFFILLLLFVLRLLFHFQKFAAEFTAHEKGAGFLTLVAASSILGTNYAQAQKNYTVAEAFFIFSIICWVLLIYGFLAGVILKKEKPTLREGMNGSWLLLTVATQSISILAAGIAPFFSEDQFLFISFTSFLLGLALYLFIIVLDFYRLLFYPVESNDIKPSYWINLGAAAITAVAAAMLSKASQTSLVFGDYSSFIKSAAVLFWAIASFWLPLIFLMEAWRYIVKKSPLNYVTDWWSMVFPLGMYTVCSWRLGELLPFRSLSMLSELFLFVAWLAWLCTFIAMVVHFARQRGNKEKI